MHEHVAEEVGYPIGKRKREDGSSATAQGSDKKEKKIEDENEKSGGLLQNDREKDRSKSSRHRHSRERYEKRGRDERRSGDRDRRSSDRRG